MHTFLPSFPSQTYPAVEYDYVPNRVHIKVGQIIHVQWTGSNTHNNGNEGGDGDTGDAGEGKGGTDRHNMMPIFDLSRNFPIPMDKTNHDAENFLNAVECYQFNNNARIPRNDCAMILFTSGQILNVASVSSTNDWNVQLDNAPASLIGGILLKFTKTGTYHYMCSRNNNFTNRSQKGTIIVEA